MSSITEISLSGRARAAGFFWLMTILAGTVALVAAPRFGIAANLTADFCYAAASLLVYGLLKPVDRTLSLVAAMSGVAGVMLGLLAMTLGLAALGQVAFLFFGLQCLLIGWLIVRSTFLPRFVGGLMAVGGCGWLLLAFANLYSPGLAASASPWLLIPGIVGEATLTLWLLVKGVQVERWLDQSGSATYGSGYARTLATLPLAIALLLAAPPGEAAAQKVDGKSAAAPAVAGHDHGAWGDDDDDGLELGVSIASNYNRVEGLPIVFGPIVRAGDRNRLELSAQAIWRTEPSATLRGEVGYRVRIDQGLAGGLVRVGGEAVSWGRPIETQGLHSREPGLAAVLFHSDLQDYFEERAWGVHVELHPAELLETRVAFRSADHDALAVSDPWSLFRGDEPWRAQPLVARGRASTLSVGVALDTRDGEAAERGVLASFGIERALDQDLTMPIVDFGGTAAGGETFADFTLAQVDLRAHRPVTDGSTLSLRVFAAGSVDETVLAPQYQRALGGIGTLPGYALFEGACGSRDVSVAPVVTDDGTTAVADRTMLAAYGCDRVLLGQAEYRGTFGRHDRDDGVHYHGRWKFEGEMAPPQWALFVDAARGQAFGDLGLAARADTGTLVDAGAGLLYGGAGVYAALPLTGADREVRVVVRLQRRF